MVKHTFVTMGNARWRLDTP